MSDVKLLLTPREAAAALSVSEKTLWTLSTPRGTLPAVRIAGCRAVRYAPDALREWIAQQQSAEAVT